MRASTTRPSAIGNFWAEYLLATKGTMRQSVVIVTAHDGGGNALHGSGLDAARQLREGKRHGIKRTEGLLDWFT